MQKGSGRNLAEFGPKHSAIAIVDPVSCDYLFAEYSTFGKFEVLFCTRKICRTSISKVRYYNVPRFIPSRLTGNVTATEDQDGAVQASRKADHQSRQPDNILCSMQRGSRSVLLPLRSVPLHDRFHHPQLHKHPQRNVLQGSSAGFALKHHDLQNFLPSLIVEKFEASPIRELE